MKRLCTDSTGNLKALELCREFFDYSIQNQMGNTCKGCGTGTSKETNTIVSTSDMQTERSKLRTGFVDLRQSSLRADGKENTGQKKNLPKLPTLRQDSESESINSNPAKASTKNMMGSQAKLHIQRDKFVKIKSEKVDGHYTVVKKLGEGSYGSVYKVIYKKTKEERAMKIIKKSDVTDEQNVFSELEVLKKLDHPNILKLYQIFEEDDFFYVITEYCEGGQVLKSLKKYKLFSERTAADIMRQLFGALVYMHSRNIVHRDLKLENIMYEFKKQKEEGSEPPIKIIDFGTSRLVHPNSALHAKMGSPFYVAPEVLNRNYNIKCDIWSCGVILYILLSGHPPFYGKTPQQIFQKIKTQPVQFEDEIWEEISNQAKDIIKSMLNRNVQERPAANVLISNSWIQNCSKTAEIDGRVLKNLQNFYFKDRFKAVVMTYLASTTISKDERRALANKFNQIDKDRSGVIQRNELIEAYKTIYKVVDLEVVERVLNILDTNGSGKIDFTEFMVAAYEKQKLIRDQCLLQAFDFFDADNTGYLDIHEVREMLGEADDQELKKIMKEIDTNRDDKISKDQFIRMIKFSDD